MKLLKKLKIIFKKAMKPKILHLMLVFISYAYYCIYLYWCTNQIGLNLGNSINETKKFILDVKFDFGTIIHISNNLPFILYAYDIIQEIKTANSKPSKFNYFMVFAINMDFFAYLASFLKFFMKGENFEPLKYFLIFNFTILIIFQNFKSIRFATIQLLIVFYSLFSLTDFNIPKNFDYNNEVAILKAYKLGNYDINNFLNKIDFIPDPYKNIIFTDFEDRRKSFYYFNFKKFKWIPYIFIDVQIMARDWQEIKFAIYHEYAKIISNYFFVTKLMEIIKQIILAVFIYSFMNNENYKSLNENLAPESKNFLKFFSMCSKAMFLNFLLDIFLNIARRLEVFYADDFVVDSNGSVDILFHYFHCVNFLYSKDWNKSFCIFHPKFFPFYEEPSLYHRYMRQLERIKTY